MQATVVKVMVEVGTSVVAGDILCVLEAMKMEQPIMAPKDGVVEAVNISVGDSISGGHLLVVLN
jgi:acetyl-CoA/propionyl-CoA carboxylase biotin carboxyl carrier protein